MHTLEKYFPQLDATQHQQFEQLGQLYPEWNEKINLISRKDIEHLYEHHILHSLSIARFLRFRDGSRIMDVGTGGGFPGLPLAILFPNCQFLLLDSIAKKLKAAADITQRIGLQNVSFQHRRVEEEKSRFDFVVSRAVMPLPDLVKHCRKNIDSASKNALPNGLICLKGGTLDDELRAFRHKADVIDLSDYYEEEFFHTKKLIYLPL